jgi:hypothetical protein
MARSLVLDFLLISDHAPVPLSVCQQELARLQMGVITLAPAPDADTVPSPGHERVALGRISIHQTLGRADITLNFEQHLRPPMSGMAPTSLDALLLTLDATHQQIARQGTLSIDVHVESSDSDSPWLLGWTMACLERLASYLDAVVFDPAAARCMGPRAIATAMKGGIIAHIALHNETIGPELRWLHTHGLQKFGQPELEITAVPQPLENEASSVLRIVAESLASSNTQNGPALRPGMRVECEGAGLLLARPTRTDAEHAASFGRLRLVTVPPPGFQPGDDATDILCTLALSTAREALAGQDWIRAIRYIDRVLAAIPELPAGLAMKARYHLAQGQPLAALEVGTHLSLCAPRSHYGPYVSGQSLSALGRFNEALAALNRAAQINPDDPEIFDARSYVNARLHNDHAAMEDRARAAMLRR